MGTIRYIKTYFNEPNRIIEWKYNSLKAELNRNPDFQVDPNPETFSEHFSGALKTVKICGTIILVCVFLSLVFSKRAGDFWDSLAGVAGICFFIMLFAGVHLLLEGPSYATYVKEKNEYFSRMKYAIQNSNSYIEFCKLFYGG